MNEENQIYYFEGSYRNIPKGFIALKSEKHYKEIEMWACIKDLNKTGGKNGRK